MLSTETIVNGSEIGSSACEEEKSIISEYEHCTERRIVSLWFCFDFAYLKQVANACVRHSMR